MTNTDIAFAHLAEIRVSWTPATETVVLCPNCKDGLLDVKHLVKTTCPSCKTAFMGMGAMVAYTSDNPDELRPFLTEALEKKASSNLCKRVNIEMVSIGPVRIPNTHKAALAKYLEGKDHLTCSDLIREAIYLYLKQKGLIKDD